MKKKSKGAVALDHKVTSSGLDAHGLGRAIDAQRQRLFKALAIVRAIARLLTEISVAGDDDLGCADALSAACDLLDDALEQLEPLKLGLGIPRS